MTRQVFLDTETTGLSAEHGDRLLEIGCIEMVDRRLTGRNLHHYVNPERSSHPDALRIHGITDAFLTDKPLFADIADDVAAFIEGAELIIHNAAFDVAFLDAEFRRLKRPLVAQLAAKVTDSVLMAREMFPGKSNSLDALCRRLEVDNTNRTLHGALLDAGLLAEVYIRLTRGQNALVMEAGESRESALGIAERIDLSGFDLPVLVANSDELEAHEAALASLDKASGGKTVWRTSVA